MERTNEELALLVQQGEPGALEDLYRQNTGIVNICAGKLYYSHGGQYNPYGLEFEDCEQLAFLGLYDAAMKFDPAKGIKLTSYMKHTVRNAFRQMYYQQDKDPMKHARSTDEEIGGEESGLTLEDGIPDPAACEAFEDAVQALYQQQARAALDTALDALPPKQQEAIRLSYWQGQAMNQIAQRQGISTSRVQQNIHRGVRTLRNAKGLQDYADQFGAKVYRSTGLCAFRSRQASSPEYLTEWLEEQKQKEQKKVDELRKRLQAERGEWWAEMKLRHAEYEARCNVDRLAEAWGAKQSPPAPPDKPL